jgi:hypothetical protein
MDPHEFHHARIISQGIKNFILIDPDQGIYGVRVLQEITNLLDADSAIAEDGGVPRVHRSPEFIVTAWLDDFTVQGLSRLTLSQQDQVPRLEQLQVPCFRINAPAATNGDYRSVEILISLLKNGEIVQLIGKFR